MDCYLSGCSVSLVIKKDNMIFSANVGNVLAFIFYSEKIFCTTRKLRWMKLSTGKKLLGKKTTSSNKGYSSSVVD